MTEVANTGERILLTKETPLMIARHTCAYRFAAGYARNKSILDIGCGEGYGSYYLAASASKVVAIDYNSGIIAYAQDRYPKMNLQFLALDVNRLSSLQDKFDLVCSFQCIEHIPDTDSFLSGISGLMLDGALFICSTPNIKDASPGRTCPSNPFHIREYLYREFKGLLENYFKEVEVFGVKRGRRLNFYRRLKKIGIFNFLPARIDPVKMFYSRAGHNSFLITKEAPETALDFIAVCKR